MANISNLIEQFILDNLNDGMIELSRNDLAEYFSVAPSQINYVLSTRFTPSKGFLIESQRGGGGFVKVTQVNLDKSNYLKMLVTKYIPTEISYNDSLSLLKELQNRNFITSKEFEMIKITLSPKVLVCPLKTDDMIRSNILKGIILEILKGDKL